MSETWLVATLWVGLALAASLLSMWLRIATALCEIVVGTIAQLAIGVAIGGALMGVNEPWVVFLSSTGAILLTFLAGAELDPVVFRMKWKEASVIGLAGFFAPFLGCTAIVCWVLHWSVQASWLAGVALSTTSVAVVYAVMLELGLNQTTFGKTVLAACFINDLGTVLALGLIFAPFTYRTLFFAVVSVGLIAILPRLTPRFFAAYGSRPSELEAKYLLLFLFGMAGLAHWAGSEPVLPAYMVGMVLAGTVGKDHALVRRLRTLTFGLLTPFYFIRAGSFVSVPALVASPVVFFVLLAGKMATKFAAVFPATKLFGNEHREGMYTTLLMSTGLTFGSISALFGLTHNIIDQTQYSHLVATVIASAVVPTLIANAFYLPRHLLRRPEAGAVRAVAPPGQGATVVERAGIAQGELT
jgi:glutathione-regulated potassium-efflux system ancillary protein KefC